MQVGMIGPGKMGGNMARRVRRSDIEVIGFNRDASATQALAAECGLLPAESAEALVAKLTAPRLVWLMRFTGTVDLITPLPSICDDGVIIGLSPCGAGLKGKLSPYSRK